MYLGANRRWVHLDHFFKALQPRPHFIDEGLSVWPKFCQLLIFPQQLNETLCSY